MTPTEEDITAALLFIKSKHNGEIPYRFGSRECAKLMVMYLTENTEPLTIDELINQIQHNAHRD